MGCEYNLLCRCHSAKLGVCTALTICAQHIESTTMMIVGVLVHTVIKDSVIHPGTGEDAMSVCTIHDFTHI